VQESALVVEVPEVDSLVDPWRQVHDPVASRGVPAHITLLYPFVPAERLDEAVLDTLAATLSEIRPFDYALASLAQFPGVIYLRPDPGDPFRELTRRLSVAFPDYPPYGGKFPESQPHVTVALVEGDATQVELLHRIQADVGPELPIRGTATAVTVFTPDRAGSWHRAHRIELGAPTRRQE